MYFTPAIAASILAFAAGVLGAPTFESRQAPTAAAPAFTPSLTQQLFLADTAADRINLLKDTDFRFDFTKDVPEAVQKNGGLVTANRKTFPALVSTGGSFALGKVKPCTMNTLHVHPRGAELQYVIKGRLHTEMIPENAVQVAGKPRVIRNTLQAGQGQVFYQGSVHTQANFECEEAEFMAFFTTEDAGAGSIAQEFFAANNEIVAGTLGSAEIPATKVDAIRNGIPASFAAQLSECVAKCKTYQAKPPVCQSDKEKADKEKADKEKADKEKADKEKADKEKADREKKNGTY